MRRLLAVFRRRGRQRGERTATALHRKARFIVEAPGCLAVAVCPHRLQTAVMRLNLGRRASRRPAEAVGA